MRERERSGKEGERGLDREEGDVHAPLSADSLFRHWSRDCLCSSGTLVLLFHADFFAWAPPKSLPRGTTVAPRFYIVCAPRRITRSILELEVVPFGRVLDLRTTISQNCEAVPRRARIQGASTFASINSSTLGSRVVKKKKKT